MIATVARIICSKRMWMHAPLGFVNGVWLVLFPPLGIGVLWAFLAYELNQCDVTGDGAFQDIVGHIVGLVVSGIVLTVLVAFLILLVGGFAWT